MRKEALKYEDLKNEFPQLGIVFVGNRAVVSFRSKDLSPGNHLDVYYGFMFWLNLGIACMKCYKKSLKDSLTNPL